MPLTKPVIFGIRGEAVVDLVIQYHGTAIAEVIRDECYDGVVTSAGKISL
jgi:hypothetical protein